jgi:hypothetical protein
VPTRRKLPIAWQDSAREAWSRLSAHGAIAIRRCFRRDTCERWATGTYAGKPMWTADFGDDQFSLGRAFYAHLEQDRSEAYFKDAAASDARVERHAPGLQAAMRELAASFVGGQVRGRRGWCGPGVHVFPAGGHVASHGGVTHFDTEGLTRHHIARRAPAITLVAMLQPPASQGGLRVWDVMYDGRDGATDEELVARNSTVTYEVGDVVVIDSYRLHQIQPFPGDRDRVSATVHLAAVDDGHWESWF